MSASCTAGSKVKPADKLVSRALENPGSNTSTCGFNQFPHCDVEFVPSGKDIRDPGSTGKESDIASHLVSDKIHS